MSDIICVTNRKICRGSFPDRVEKIAACRPAGIILREKDLSAEEYCVLAGQVMEICARYDVPCILHNFIDAAIELRANAVHLPLNVLRGMTAVQKKRFAVIGASCHSTEDALEAQELGCTYITAGHIFETDCKKGLPGRGLEFLHSVCTAVSIPVYGIGGIDKSNIALVRGTGAAGACLMSSLMICENVQEQMTAMEEGK